TSDICCSIFFFSSRRRHTSFSRDWSSDVCSSDLERLGNLERRRDRVPLVVEEVLGEVARLGALQGVDADHLHGAGDGFAADPEQIGRASCREREWITDVAVGFKKKE